MTLYKLIISFLRLMQANDKLSDKPTARWHCAHYELYLYYNIISHVLYSARGVTSPWFWLQSSIVSHNEG